MSLRLRELTLRLDQDECSLASLVETEMGLPSGAVSGLLVVRKGIDARKKPNVLRVYTVEFSVPDERAVLERHVGNARLEKVLPQEPAKVCPFKPEKHVVVVGMGPAGLFSAFRLAQYGFTVTLVERGRPVELRVQDVRRFWAGEGLDEASNVQFGEGGAGTFSDGKLTTRVNHPWTRLVLQTLVQCGAPEDILVQAKPHVGTDRLRLVLVNFRKLLQSLGVTIRFESRLTGILKARDCVAGAVLNDNEELLCDALLLAPGHSARDTYRMLQTAGVSMEAKPFAVGLRVEHPVECINRIQYGMAAHPNLPAAEYALSFNDSTTGRGIYSFCMCPGGEVVTASSESGGIVVNGMSYLSRGGAFSNSALVVSVRPEDFDGNDCLAGVGFQRELEQKAFRAAGGDYMAPAQNLMTFMGRRRESCSVRSTCRPGVREYELDRLLPAFVSQGIRHALPQFDRRMRGFVTSEATLIGVETRTSAPVRILRHDDGQSVSLPGLYPVGEGAGYAGGIMSAALDGLKTAEKIAMKVKDEHAIAQNIR